MKTPFNTRVVFYQVHENKTKLKRIIETTQAHFERKEPFLILAETKEAVKFVDELLWKEGFLPHITTDTETNELIVVTQSRNNLNHAKAAFNLCSTAVLFTPSPKIIYEFEDLTAPFKKNLSSSRFDVYKNAGLLIEAR